ncbi:MAG: thiamine biosynthesis protein ThiF [Chryseobacterium sp.]|nr:MAG: thiamine biosynthesis protein ThiF [Chryseobacterium sp.]
MEDRLSKVQRIISDLEKVLIEEPFVVDQDLNAVGKVKVIYNENGDTLSFTVKVLPEYPLKRLNAEAINFYNEELIEYGHVMGDGSICIHTSHSFDVKKKLEIDFASLKRWIQRYFVNKEQDDHYEHIIMQPVKFKEEHHSFIFTDIEHTFRAGDFGFFDFTQIHSGIFYDTNINNHIILNFKNKHNKVIAGAKWSSTYTHLPPASIGFGLYIYVEQPPVVQSRFIISNWSDLEDKVPTEFFVFLHGLQRNNQKSNGVPIPLMIGYKISEDEIHWQATMLEFGKFPIGHEKVNQKWEGFFIDQKIDWMMTRNSSYKYFFGRGKFTSKISDAKTLIIGTGAIGSMVATTLVRGGCQNIDLLDFDVKEPENVCRSEYAFSNGITNKVDELKEILTSISPFLEVRAMDSQFFHLHTKIFNSARDLKSLQNALSGYDLILDCSTDNDLMHILGQVSHNQLMTLSITNNAQALVCGAEPNHYTWVMNQFENVLQNDIQDVYNPTGCWSPTFKASYNDISVLVQYALKHINVKLRQGTELRNFVIETDETNGFHAKLVEF